MTTSPTELYALAGSHVNPTDSLQKRGEKLHEVTTNIGCGLWRFEKTGRRQLEGLIKHGLNPWDKLLDIGSGALCGAYWMIHFLDAGGYHGIEPNQEMFRAGLENIPEKGLFEAKKPSFVHNDQYDFSGFNTRFDFFHAHSIWTHAPKKDIEKMLDGFVAHTNPGARFPVSLGSEEATASCRHCRASEEVPGESVETERITSSRRLGSLRRRDSATLSSARS